MSLENRFYIMSNKVTTILLQEMFAEITVMRLMLRTKGCCVK
jgi:hypothetical protein